MPEKLPNLLGRVVTDTFYVGMATDLDTLSGSGELFTITVEAAEGVSVGDSTILHFESFRFNEDTTGVDTQDGVVYIAPIRPPGDATDNGEVTAYDASWILQHTVGLLTLIGPDSVAADVSGDTTISGYDAALVLQYVVRKITRFPVEEGQQAKVADYATRTVRLGEMEALSDGQMRLPILIDEMEGVVAGELTLSFAGNAEDVTISTSELTSDYLLAYNVKDGRIRASFAGAESSAGPGPVLEVMFDEPDAGLPSSLRLERVSLNEGRIPVRVEGVESETPRAYRLAQNYPNPFNPQTTIAYDVAKTGTVRLSVYTLNGQRVRTLVDAGHLTGSYSVVWDGKDDTGKAVASGVYLCRMVGGDYSVVRKLLLVR